MSILAICFITWGFTAVIGYLIAAIIFGLSRLINKMDNF